MTRFWSEMMMWSTVGLGLVACLLPSPDAWAERSSVERVSAVVDVQAVAPRPESRSILLAGYDANAPKTYQDKQVARAQNALTARITGRRVNLRGGPSTTFERLGSVVADEIVTLTGKTDGAWVQVRKQGALMPTWIHGKFVSAL